tara:strand:- start:35655 stop:36599 length:945 start_codon:yes stop_codon:yes gene_type:complete
MGVQGVETAPLPLLRVYTAGENITKGNAVYISSASTVSKAATANISKVIGVASETVTSGNLIKIVVYGPVSVTADGVIAAGDLCEAAGTAGRVIKVDNNHDHTGGTDFPSVTTNVAVGAHGHDQDATRATSDNTTVAGSNHTHTVPATATASVNVGLSTHEHGNSGSPSATETVPNTAAHTHTQQLTSETNGGSHFHSQSASNNNSGGGTVNVASQSHVHNVDGAPTTTDLVADQTHTHTTNTPTGGPSTIPASTHTHINEKTDDAAAGDRVLVGGEYHTHTITSYIEKGVVLGKAETAAAGAGSTLTLFVCLS